MKHQITTQWLMVSHLKIFASKKQRTDDEVNKKNVTCYNQMIVAIVDVLTSFIFIFTNDNR
jgi:hypothetical protein